MWHVFSQIELAAKHVTVEVFAFRSFNKTYLITACPDYCFRTDTSRTVNTPPGDDSSSLHNSYLGGVAKVQVLLRLALPIYPWYKTESEVATMEFLRAKTKIPVPDPTLSTVQQRIPSVSSGF
jgi:hypothetical protein